MRRLALLSVVLLLALLAGGSSGAPSRASTSLPALGTTPDKTLSLQSITLDSSPEGSGGEEPTPEPTPTPTPTPTPVPEPSGPGELKPGVWAQVWGTGSCLNVRWAPGIKDAYAEDGAEIPVINCLPDGFVARISEQDWDGSQQPVRQDGHDWWHLVGVGWVAGDWLRFHHEGDYPWPERPDLAGAGLIAYVDKDGDVRLMNADGSGQRLLFDIEGKGIWVDYLSWSPAGDRLSFMASEWSENKGSRVVTRIVDLEGRVVAEYEGLAVATWSPDGGRLAALRVDEMGDMGGYYSTPVVVDLASGEEAVVGPAGFYSGAPLTWSPDGVSLAFICLSTEIPVYGEDGSVVDWQVEHDCGGDGLHIAAADGNGSRLLLAADPEKGVYFSGPSWSPDGSTIALFAGYWQEGGCRGYLLVDADAGQIGACFELPPPGGFGGHCGGSSENGVSDWSADGLYLVYHSDLGQGQNGVWTADVTTGEKRLIPITPASYVSLASSGGHLAFTGGGYIWTADLDGSNLTLLAEGGQPAWQP